MKSQRQRYLEDELKKVEKQSARLRDEIMIESGAATRKLDMIGKVFKYNNTEDIFVFGVSTDSDTYYEIFVDRLGDDDVTIRLTTRKLKGDLHLVYYPSDRLVKSSVSEIKESLSGAIGDILEMVND